MKRSAVLAIVVLAVFALAGCVQFEKISYNPSGAPAIKNLPKQKMLIAEAKGEPEKISTQCISSLYMVYFKLKMKEMTIVAPRARWTISPDKVRSEWTGIFAMPVPEEINSLPDMKKKPPVEVKIGYWEYGDTAEIMHTGSYDSEKATVDRLMQFIKENGYEPAGPHEEVYIKGPGMFGKGDPKKYLTLIRYQVKKAAAAGKKSG